MSNAPVTPKRWSWLGAALVKVAEWSGQEEPGAVVMRVADATAKAPTQSQDAQLVALRWRSTLASGRAQRPADF